MSHVQIKKTSLSANPNENGPEGIRQIENGCNRDDINNVSTRYSDKDTSFYSENHNNFQSQASQPNKYIHSLVSNDMEVKKTHEKPYFRGRMRAVPKTNGLRLGVISLRGEDTPRVPT